MTLRTRLKHAARKSIKRNYRIKLQSDNPINLNGASHKEKADRYYSIKDFIQTGLKFDGEISEGLRAIDYAVGTIEELVEGLPNQKYADAKTAEITRLNGDIKKLFETIQMYCNAWGDSEMDEDEAENPPGYQG
jgi:hypothetical protein